MTAKSTQDAMSRVQALVTGHKKTESRRNLQLSVLLIILAATYSPTDTLCRTIGDGALNFQVRHGTGCVHPSMTTRNLYA